MSRMKPVREPHRWLRPIIRHPFAVLLTAALLTAVFVWRLPDLRFETSIYDLAIEDLAETSEYMAFKEQFGCEEIILVVLRTQGSVFDPQAFQEVETLSSSFEQIKGVRRVISLSGIKKDMDVTGGWDVEGFERAIDPVDLFSRNLISEDRSATAITLVLEDAEEKGRLIQDVQDLIDRRQNGIRLYQIGMPLVSKALAEYTEKDFQRLPPVTFAVIVVMLFLFLRSLRGILIPAGSVLVALAWTFGLMAWTGVPLSMLTMIVPIFIIAVGTAYCMYIFSEYQEAFRETTSSREAVFSCFTRIAFPTVLAVATTTVGLGSLLLNRIQSIREFALFACFGIWSILAITLIVLPAFLSLLPVPNPSKAPPFSRPGIVNRFLDAVVQVNLHHRRWTFLIITALCITGVAGIFRLRIETNPVGYFKPGTEISRHFHDIYQDLAGSFPVNVVLDSGVEDFFEDPEHLDLLEKIAPFFRSLDGVDKSISFADYLKLVNYASNRYESEAYAMPREGFEVRMLMNNYKTMLGQDMFERFMSRDLSKANILLRTHISSSEDFLDLKASILDHLRSILPDSMDVRVTGFGMVISQSSHLLTQGQIKSLSVTLVLIFAIMFFLFLSAKVGLIAIVPNCFPLIMNFGIMGWLGIELSVATSLIASIAIGLAVDDTIHYLVRYNQEFKKDLNRERALRDSLHGVGRPILFTTLTIGAGFFVLTFSLFSPTAVFGLMMMITMASALVADLILLPSLMTHVELVTVWDLIRIKLGKDPQEGIPLFDGLSRNQVHYILMAGALDTRGSGEVLFRKGEMSDSMFAVISGELEVVDVLDDTDTDSLHGSKRLIATLKAGDVVGEMGMVRACTRSATVIATRPSELLRINDRMIRRLHWLYPPTAQRFFFNLMSGVCDRLEDATRCLSDTAVFDSLTGLITREHFVSALEREMARAYRYESAFSLCLMDLDNFGAINHLYGHEVGDRFISEIGAFLLAHLRKSDVGCRYSGQQFAFLFVHSSLEKGRNACERFRQRIAHMPFMNNGHPVYLTASIGVASMDPHMKETPQEMLRLAADALERAKRNGKNRVESFG